MKAFLFMLVLVVCSVFSLSAQKVTETENGVEFDFSAEPIADQVYLYSDGPHLEEPFEQNMNLPLKKVVAGSCEGPGNCIINSSTAPYALKRLVFNDGTIATF